MSEPIRYIIDDTERVRPVVRLAHMILRAGLEQGLTTIELSSSQGEEMPVALADSGTGYRPLMAFPPMVYGALLERFHTMAEVDRVIHVTLGGREVFIPFSSAPNGESMSYTLTFPARTAQPA